MSGAPKNPICNIGINIYSEDELAELNKALGNISLQPLEDYIYTNFSIFKVQKSMSIDINKKKLEIQGHKIISAPINLKIIDDVSLHIARQFNKKNQPFTLATSDPSALDYSNYYNIQTLFFLIGCFEIYTKVTGITIDFQNRNIPSLGNFTSANYYISQTDTLDFSNNPIEDFEDRHKFRCTILPDTKSNKPIPEPAPPSQPIPEPASPADPNKPYTISFENPTKEIEEEESNSEPQNSPKIDNENRNTNENINTNENRDTNENRNTNENRDTNEESSQIDPNISLITIYNVGEEYNFEEGQPHIEVQKLIEFIHEFFACYNSHVDRIRSFYSENAVFSFHIDKDIPPKLNYVEQFHRNLITQTEALQTSAKGCLVAHRLFKEWQWKFDIQDLNQIIPIKVFPLEYPELISLTIHGILSDSLGGNYHFARTFTLVYHNDPQSFLIEIISDILYIST